MVKFLTQDNFSLQNGGKKMVCDVDGILLVMFKTDSCPHCRQFLPIFAKMGSLDSRLTFACINIENNRKCIQMAKNTKTPIKAVPTIILYYNGNPYARYTGDRSGNALSAFIDKMLNKILPMEGSMSAPNQAFMQRNQPVSSTSTSFGGPTEDAPIDKDPTRPILPSGITKTPHNAPYLAYLAKKQ